MTFEERENFRQIERVLVKLKHKEHVNQKRLNAAIKSLDEIKELYENCRAIVNEVFINGSVSQEQLYAYFCGEKLSIKLAACVAQEDLR